MRRILCAKVIAAAVMCGMACPYYVIHHNLPRAVLMAALAAVGVAAAVRAARGTGVSLLGAFLGAAAGFVALSFCLPYTSTSLAWGMTPETRPSQLVFLALYFVGATLGGLLGGTLPFARSRAV